MRDCDDNDDDEDDDDDAVELWQTAVLVIY